MAVLIRVLQGPLQPPQGSGLHHEAQSRCLRLVGRRQVPENAAQELQASGGMQNAKVERLYALTGCTIDALAWTEFTAIIHLIVESGSHKGQWPGSYFRYTQQSKSNCRAR